jgi:autotransporter-associated beta strand protein
MNFGTVVKRAALATAIAVCLEASTSAALFTWNGAAGGGGFTWSDNTKWTPNTGNPNAVDDIASLTRNLSSGTTTAITLDTNKTVGTLTIGDSASTFGRYNVTGTNMLIFDVTTGNAKLNKPNGIANTSLFDEISAPVLLNDDLDVKNDIAGTGRIVVSGVISGSKKITNLPGGTLVTPVAGRIELNNPNNTFTGGVVVAEGAGPVSVGTLTAPSSDFANGKGPLGTGQVTLNGTQLILTSSTTSPAQLIENDFLLNVPVVPATSRLTTNGTTEVSGVISGAGSLRKSGSGTLILSGTSTYTGTTELEAVNLVLGSNAPSGAPGALGNSTSALLINPTGTDVANLLTGGAVAIGRAVDIVATGGSGIVGIGGLSNSNSSFDGLVSFQRNINVGQVTTGGILSVTGGLAANNANPLTVTFGKAAALPAPEFFGNVLVDSDITESGGGALAVIVNGGSVTFATGNTNSYTGMTTVNAGKLLVNGLNSGDGAFSVASGATLGGSGSVDASAISISGTLSPGSSIESFAGGALAFSNGSTFEYELDTLSLDGDLQVANGNLDLAGTVNLTLTELASGTVSPGDKLTLINYSGDWNNGTFTYLGNPLLDDTELTVGSNTWTIDYNDSLGGANFSSDQTLGKFVTITAVPEPATFVLMGIGLAGLAMMRKKRVA